MSMGKQTLTEILTGIETEFFRRLDKKRLSIYFPWDFGEKLRGQIKRDYLKAVEKALADMRKRGFIQ